jgi:hypothetical protein
VAPFGLEAAAEDPLAAGLDLLGDPGLPEEACLDLELGLAAEHAAQLAEGEAAARPQPRHRADLDRQPDLGAEQAAVGSLLRMHGPIAARDREGEVAQFEITRALQASRQFGPNAR